MPGQSATERDRAGCLPAMVAPAFTGRGRELGALGRVLAAGPPAVVLIEGEAGIGKTRLLCEYLASAVGGERRAIVATCPPLARPQTLGAVAEGVRVAAAAGVGGLGLSPLAGALRPLFPEWSDHLPPAPEQAEDASAARYRVFAALAELLDRFGAGLLAVEDAHWADEATIEFALFLASREPRPVSLAVSYRPEDVLAGSLLPRLARLACGPAGLRLTLGPLGRAETAGLMSSMLGGEQLSDEFAAFVHERTEGVPLAVEESVRLLAGRDDLARPGGRWIRRPLGQLQVPATIRDAVLERAGRLAPDARTVLEAAAVLAGPAGEATVAAVAGICAERARAGLAQTLGCGLLGEDGRGLVSFRHALATRAVYEAIPGPHRRVLHRRAGQVLEDLTPPPAAQLAQHFREAGDAAQWRRYAEQAADLALAAGDEASAAVLLHDLVTSAGLPAPEIARLMNKIPLLALTRDDQLRDLACTIRDVLRAGKLGPGVEAGVRFLLGRVLLVREEFDAARAELERAAAGLPAGSAAAARAMILLGVPKGARWPAAAHLRWLRRAAAIDATLDPAERLRLTVDRVSALLLLGEEAGWAEAARMPGDASTPMERRQLTRGQLNVGLMAMLWGRYAKARGCLARALELAEAHRYTRLRDSILVALVHLDWFTGAWDGLAQRAASLAGNEGLPPMDTLEAVLITGLLHAAVGDRALAAERLGLAVAQARRSGAVDYHAEPAAALARVTLAEGQPGDALRITDEPIGIVARKGIWLWAADLAPARVSALLANGRAVQAGELVTAFARGLHGRDAPAPKAGLALCRATLADSRGEPGRAAALFARAAAAWQALPRPHDALLARESQARCLLAAGKGDTGLPLLSDVFQGLCELGARGDAGRVRRTLRDHGVDARPPRHAGRPSYGNQLSPRELEVVRLLVTGRTDREIAESLFVSAKTVAYHLDSARRKLNVQSRTALAVTAVDAGIVSGRSPERAGIIGERSFRK